MRSICNEEKNWILHSSCVEYLLKNIHSYDIIIITIIWPFRVVITNRWGRWLPAKITLALELRNVKITRTFPSSIFVRSTICSISDNRLSYLVSEGFNNNNVCNLLPPWTQIAGIAQTLTRSVRKKQPLDKGQVRARRKCVEV